jgi:hypothetical protein
MWMTYRPSDKYTKASHSLSLPHAPQQVEQLGFVHPFALPDFFESLQTGVNLLRRHPRAAFAPGLPRAFNRFQILGTQSREVGNGATIFIQHFNRRIRSAHYAGLLRCQGNVLHRHETLLLGLS